MSKVCPGSRNAVQHAGLCDSTNKQQAGDSTNQTSKWHVSKCQAIAVKTNPNQNFKLQQEHKLMQLQTP